MERKKKIFLLFSFEKEKKKSDLSSLVFHKMAA